MNALKIFWLEVYLDMRKARGSRFLFISRNISFFDLSRLVFYEYTSVTISDTHLCSLVIADLQNKGLLHKSNCIKYHFYELRTVTFHDVYLKTSDNQFFCRGTSTDLMEAYAKALGEVFERTSIKYPPQSGVVITTESELESNDAHFFSPRDFAQATPEQKKKFVNFNIEKNDVFAWVRVESIYDNSETLIPLQSVYYGTHTSYTEKSIIQQTTHGAGASFDAEGAVRSGLFEVVHRHFFLKSWYFNEDISVVEHTSIPKSVIARTIIDELTEHGFFVHCFNYTTEAKMPTIICILEKNGGWYCGGSTALTLAGALTRSVSEAFATYLWVQQTTARGEHHLTEDMITSLDSGFVDTKANAHTRVYLFSNAYFVSHLDAHLVKKSSAVLYDTSFDQDSLQDTATYAIQHFDSVFQYQVRNRYLDEYAYSVCRVIVPQSYYFALDEKYSRPLLRDGRYPQMTEINPFP